MSIPKPLLRNLNTAQLKKQLVVLIGATAAVTLAYKVGVVDARKRRYENFYKSYDADQHLKEMLDAGMLESGES